MIEERKASATESRVARTVDVNKVETKRAKLTRAAYDQGPSARPSKDQHGNNQKRHYATWKYFVRKAPPADAGGLQEEGGKLPRGRRGVGPPARRRGRVGVGA